MDLEPDEVRQCLEHPTSVKSALAEGTSYYFGDRITCVVGYENRVVTVLWRTVKHWDADFGKGLPYRGREAPR